MIAYSDGTSAASCQVASFNLLNIIMLARLCSSASTGLVPGGSFYTGGSCTLSACPDSLEDRAAAIHSVLGHQQFQGIQHLRILLPVAACNATNMTIHDVESRGTVHSTRVSLPLPVYQW